ncbi:hypothetical protein [Streptomyces uncialis]|uniref:hypothetical protein n=1 Tax=Streptomyces uncialis TaxID=1048205 RepID=UPI00386592DE|nr:hypothetical protein OG924_36645 [Streptomyces uncialis]
MPRPYHRPAPLRNDADIGQDIQRRSVLIELDVCAAVVGTPGIRPAAKSASMGASQSVGCASVSSGRVRTRAIARAGRSSSCWAKN